MKSLLISLVIIGMSVPAIAQMDLPPVGKNPRATLSEEVGITSITIKYSRPGVKGREGKIWGGVVANGFGTFNFITGKNTSPWRAGANEATLITFEHDVKVEGHELKAGSYALFIAMDDDTATLIFSKQTEAWGSFYYKPEDDVLQVKVKSVTLDKTVEWLKYEFIDHDEKSCVIAMQWEKRSVPFKVEIDVDQIVLNRLRAELIGVKGFISGNLIHASMYYFDKNMNLEEALSWAQRAVTGRPFGQTGFDAYQNLATGYEKLNRLSEADSVMKEGLTIANINQYISYGRALIVQKRADKALEIMHTAQAKFGDVYAVNHGLSYAYSAKRNYPKALEYAGKALVQAPTAQSKALISSNINKLKEGKDINP